jgi:hypothetical protein
MQDDAKPTAVPPTQDADVVAKLRELLGQDVVFLPIKPGEKSPWITNWREARIEKMSDALYLKRLRRGNIGVVVGEPSKGLCSIDIDDDEAIEPFLELKPLLPIRKPEFSKVVRKNHPFAMLWVKTV